MIEPVVVYWNRQLRPAQDAPTLTHDYVHQNCSNCIQQCGGMEHQQQGRAEAVGLHLRKAQCPQRPEARGEIGVTSSSSSRGELKGSECKNQADSQGQDAEQILTRNLLRTAVGIPCTRTSAAASRLAVWVWFRGAPT
jgi:hypothetical protein